MSGGIVEGDRRAVNAEPVATPGDLAHASNRGRSRRSADVGPSWLVDGQKTAHFPEGSAQIDLNDFPNRAPSVTMLLVSWSRDKTVAPLPW